MKVLLRYCYDIITRYLRGWGFFQGFFSWNQLGQLCKTKPPGWLAPWLDESREFLGRGAVNQTLAMGRVRKVKSFTGWKTIVSSLKKNNIFFFFECEVLVSGRVRSLSKPEPQVPFYAHSFWKEHSFPRPVESVGITDRFLWKH